MQFISVDQPRRTQRARRDRSLSRCFPSGGVGWSSLSSDYSFVKAHISFQWVTPRRHSLYSNSGATLVGLALIWEHNSDTAHKHKTTSIAALHRRGRWLSETRNGRINFNISLHSSKRKKTLLTLHLHTLCIYCKTLSKEHFYKRRKNLENSWVHFNNTAIRRMQISYIIREVENCLCL